MSLPELFILAVGLSMDAFAVSICKGLCVPKAGLRECGTAGIYFGGFQALMPLLGYLLGVRFKEYITSIDHWIAFILLGIIGINMIREARSAEEECEVCSAEGSQNPFSFKAMLPLAIATSIDALAVGVTLAFLQAAILPAITFIGTVTFAISAAGIRIGNIFGSKWKSKAELAGGIILICMGIKILLEHLGIIR
ncbi:MAG: manganese efflux pump [Lachnospiraceae bacterium]|jgi:putative Mn2+ efflux pump MntP|nr:manganese efflux pump [Lachnospiraceae bacterium]